MRIRMWVVPFGVALVAFRILAVSSSAGVLGPTDGFRAADHGWVQRNLQRMSLRDKVAQLVKIRVPGRFMNRDSREYQTLSDQIRRNHIGGLVLFAGDVYETSILLNELQQLSSLPLVVAADFERGASFRIADSTSFPWTMALGAAGSEDYAYREGVITAREARALGVHWVYAPVLDVNNNPDNPVINIRSFGEDPHLVARLGAAFIRGCRDNGVMTTAKHFPGHGDTATDSHIGLQVIGSDQARLEAVELVPFKSAIAAGVDSIMTAHLAIPRIAEEARLPATLSAKILTDLLRQQMDFRGLVVTDALEMGGITERYWGGLAAVRAVQAGADMLLLPPDADVAIEEVVRAVQRGEIPESRLNRSVEAILAAKTRLGLHKSRTVDLTALASLIATPSSVALAQEIADHSITLVRDTNRVLPLDPRKPVNMIVIGLSSSNDASPAPVFQSEIRKRFPSATQIWVDPRTPGEEIDSILSKAKGVDLILVATVVRVVSGKGDVAIPVNQRDLMRRIIQSGKKVAWLAFGNPYLLREYPQVGTYLCTFSTSEGSQLAAAKALTGEIPLTGKLPVSIPGQAAYGEGILLPKLDMTLKRTPVQTPPSPGLFGRVVALLHSYVERRAFPGGVVVVGHRGRTVLEAAAGRLDYSPDSDAVTADTVYDLASLTKAVGTTTVGMMLYESGRLILDEPVQDFMPEFRGAAKEKVLVRHLLMHTSGLPAFLPMFRTARSKEEVLAQAMAAPLEFEPGTKTQYSDLGMILFGEIAARSAARPLDRFLTEQVLEPLGMKSTCYNPPAAWKKRIAPTEQDPWRGRLIRGEVHDENSYAMGGVSGHAGLFSSARDLAVFAQWMLNGGIYDHRRLLKPGTIERFTRLDTARPELTRSMGWMKPLPNAWTGKVFSASAFGHTGFTGTSLWIDPEREFFIVFLTNRIHPARDNPLIEEARRTISESVVEGLQELIRQ